ncbi:MAG: DarT ssDNA thymidine ADP-ribosyltransferase family protein [Rikenellaceae bacterium]
MKANFEEFKNEIQNRGIGYLVHFTPTINLLSIYEQKKVLCRNLLEQFDVLQTDIFDFVEFTDDIRFDDKSYINLSIQHSNSYLLNRFIEKTSNDTYINWCILKINPKYIYHKDTLFSVTNAANSHNKYHVGISGDIDKFKSLFASSINVVTSYTSKTINRGNLKNKYPTDEQAEVLVKNEILVDDIIQVCFKDDVDLATAKAALYDYDTTNFVVDKSLFKRERT